MQRLALTLLMSFALLAYLSQAGQCLAQAGQSASPRTLPATASDTQNVDHNKASAQNQALATASTSTAPDGDVASIAVDLLRQSHDLNHRITPSLLPQLLDEQTETMLKWRGDLAQQWAEELFGLSQEGEDDEHYYEASAIAIVARLDPEHALEMLHSMPAYESENGHSVFLPKIEAAKNVFRELASRRGVSAIPTLEDEAERLGAEGHYPYAALGEATLAALAQSNNGSKQARDVMQSVFRRAFARYRREPHSYLDNVNFGEMLNSFAMAANLPSKKLFRAALRVLVANLLTTDTNQNHFAAEVETRDGRIAKVNNAIDAALLQLGPMIHKLDPELARNLESNRPGLKVALEYTAEQWNAKFGPRDTERVDPNFETRRDALRLSHVNPEAAISKARQVSDDNERVHTMLDVAMRIAGDHPERANALILEVQHADQGLGKQLQLNLISAQAYVAKAQHRTDDMHDLLQKGFQLANELVAAQQDPADWRKTLPAMGSLVQFGIQNDADMTIGFVQGLPPSFLKAQVLLGAASALDMPQLPLSSRPRQEVVVSRWDIAIADFDVSWSSAKETATAHSG
jgi:hypothetical protein